MSRRSLIEHFSRGNAGVQDTDGDYLWVRVLNSFEMYVHKQDQSVTPCLVRDGFWESWITKWVIDHLNTGDVFWDIGANAGYYSFLAFYRGALVHAFEPNPLYADMITATKDRQKIVFGFKVHPIALSDHHGSMPLHIPGDLHGSASLNGLPEGYEFSDITVEVKPFDDIARPAGPDTVKHLLKIDAEGEEERILNGARNFLASIPDPVVMLEYTPNAYSEHFLDDLFNEWSVSLITYDGVDEPVSKEWIESQTDWTMLVLRRNT